jgi:pentose-5-phosphate-3-epimerase
MIQSNSAVGKPGKKVKIAAGLFWNDYSILGQVKEFSESGENWIQIEVRDGIFKQLGMPRGGIDIIKELGLKVGVWGWQNIALDSFASLIPYFDIIEYKTWYPHWQPSTVGKSSHVVNPQLAPNFDQLHKVIVEQELEQMVDLMMDGGHNKKNVDQFVNV